MGWILDVDVYVYNKDKSSGFALSFSLSLLLLLLKTKQKTSFTITPKYHGALISGAAFFFDSTHFLFCVLKKGISSQLFCVCETHLMCYMVCVCVCLFPFDRHRPNIFHTSWKKIMRLLLIRRCCLIPTLCSPSFLIGPDVDGILNAQPFFFPGWNIIKIDANEFIYLLFCFGVKLETLERDEDWISIGRMRIFQFDSLRLGFCFYRTSCCTQQSVGR